MKKGISFYFGFDIEPEKRAKMIADAGLDTVMTTADPIRDKSNGTIEKQIELFAANGLSVSSLHSRYVERELFEFFKEGEIGDKIESNYIKDVEVAAKFGFNCVVIHLFGEFNEIGINRIKRILKVCEKHNVPLAFENIDDPKTFKSAMEYFNDSPYVKFCYDVGHNHFVDPKFNYIDHYKDKLVCLHLHDNMGERDDHTLNKYGNINWEEVAKRLATVPQDISLDYELIFNKKCPDTPEQVLAEAYKQACELENMILDYKSDIKNL